MPHVIPILLFASALALAIPSRPARAAPVDDFTNLSGLWLDAERAAQGLMLEQIDPPTGAPDGGLPRVIVSWYTWAPAADPDPGPRWLFGVGRREGHRIQVELQIAVAGNSPFEAQDAPAQLAEWGFAEIRVSDWSTDTRNTGVIEFAGPVGWGEGERQLAQLTANGSGLDYDVLLDESRYSDLLAGGTYSDPTQVGQGWILNMYRRHVTNDDGEQVPDVQSILLWFTYDAEGRPSWLVGLDASRYDDQFHTMLRASAGGTFEGGSPTLVPVEAIFLQAQGGPPLQIGCGDLRRITVMTDAAPAMRPSFEVGRLTLPFDPNVLPPDLCFSR
jgi:hypothetical protein